MVDFFQHKVSYDSHFSFNRVTVPGSKWGGHPGGITCALWAQHYEVLGTVSPQCALIDLGMGSANEGQHYKVTPSLIGWAHIKNDLLSVTRGNSVDWVYVEPFNNKAIFFSLGSFQTAVYSLKYALFYKTGQYNVCHHCGWWWLGAVAREQPICWSMSEFPVIYSSPPGQNVNKITDDNL